MVGEHKRGACTTTTNREAHMRSQRQNTELELSTAKGAGPSSKFHAGEGFTMAEQAERVSASSMVGRVSRGSWEGSRRAQGHTTAGPRPSRPRPWGRAMVERSMSLSEIRAGKERRPDLAEEAENYAWPQGRDTGEEPRHAGTLGRTRQEERGTSRRRSEQGGALSHGGTLGAGRKLQGAGRAHG